MEPELREHLKRIEEDLHGVRQAVEETWFMLFYRGLLRGGGFVIGTVIAIAIAGWLLSIFGIIPGADRLQEILEAQVGM